MFTPSGCNDLVRQDNAKNNQIHGQQRNLFQNNVLRCWRLIFKCFINTIQVFANVLLWNIALIQR